MLNFTTGGLSDQDLVRQHHSSGIHQPLKRNQKSCVSKRGSRVTILVRTSNVCLVCNLHSRSEQLAGRLPKQRPDLGKWALSLMEFLDLCHITSECAPPGLQVWQQNRPVCLQVQKSSDGSSRCSGGFMGSVQLELCFSSPETTYSSAL